ncbi:MAG: glutathione binding-like protein [Steroidobacteraceae bacterium]
MPGAAIDDGSVLTEGMAIMPFIADRAQLAPAAGTIERYRLHEWLGYINSEIHKSFGPFFVPGATDAQKAAATQVRRCLGFCAGSARKQLFLMGERFTVADAYLFTVLGWCGYVGIDLGQWPALKAYHARIAARPAVQAAMKAEGLIKSDRPAYLLVQGTVTDLEGFKAYNAALPPIYQKFGGHYLTITPASKVEIAEGEPRNESILIARFPSKSCLGLRSRPSTRRRRSCARARAASS